MANGLTPFIPDLFEARDVISREFTGFIPAVTRDSSATRAALNEKVYVPITGEEASHSNSPGVTAPDNGDTTVGNAEITISKSKFVPIRFNGEETKGARNSGMFSSIIADRAAQAMRTLVNEIEADLWGAAYKKASLATGSAGTAPFNTANDISDFAAVARILDENGAPVSGRELVLGHAAIQNLRGKQSVLYKVNEAGSADMLRDGMTDRVQNFALRHSHQVGIHTKGAGTGYDVDLTAGYGIGDTTIHLDGGTVNTTGIAAGDVVTFAGDTNKYVVGTGATDAEADIVLNAPGLRATLADAVEMTIGNSFTANVAFVRSAIVLATRAPAMPDGGDMADDVTTITDPMTGLTFEFALYKQFHQNVIHVRLAWGQAAIKSEHIALLLG